MLRNSRESGQFTSNSGSTRPRLKMARDTAGVMF